ncbi:aminoglycoside phosphotransferase [Brachybacterium endophyticum]|uniref:Aminoglycoside phosphotransferase n=1 Tax=Brachybacterium endophyticum TaxID=2182385 RepID=A0A2U2RJQ5_9MICO|nr:phosphotransferase [Brachybacterium endophyticum]PWH06076.1 aminoglycoside phosphotransferase [Brachybacterium endophyticum]
MERAPDQPEAEVPLQGGNASAGVVRIGGTVRKPWLPQTPLVTAFTIALRERGIDLPVPLGRDEQGRQVLEFVPGTLALESGPLPLEDLRRVGALVRRIHEASAAIPPGELERAAAPAAPSEEGTAPAGWSDPLLPVPGPPELICHNDLAPWDLVLDGERMVVIDLDGAGPSTRAWDLAYAAQSFADLFPHRDPEDSAARLRAFVVKGYRADEKLRAGLPALLGRRTGAMADMLLTAHEQGIDPWGTMHTEGHGAIWSGATAYVCEHEEMWRRALA